MSENKKHYVYGSGMFGCLYDYGPHFCENIENAIKGFTQVFENSIESDELIEMKENLRECGTHSFRLPAKAGAHYCQVCEENGEMPEDLDD